MATLGDIHQAELTANSNVESTTTSTRGALDRLDKGGSIKSNYDFVGIANASGVEEMMNAIDLYCGEVTKILDEMEATANPKGTFAGTYTTEITKFTTAIKNSCMANVDQLKDFKKDLNRVYTAMQEKSQSAGAALDAGASSVNGAAVESN